MKNVKFFTVYQQNSSEKNHSVRSIKDCGPETHLNIGSQRNSICHFQYLTRFTFYAILICKLQIRTVFHEAMIHATNFSI